MRWSPVLAVALVAVTIPAIIAAQTQSPEKEAVLGRDEFDTAVQRLQAQMSELSVTLSELKNTTDNNAVRTLQLVERYESEFETLKATVEEAIADQKQILDAISRQSSTGEYLPSLAANMSNTEFAAEMKDVVNQSIPKESILRITNKSQWERDIWINESFLIRLKPGADRKFKVPTGTVTTRLPGQKLVNWTVGPPSHVEAVDIIDRQPTTTTVTKLWTQPVTVIYP